ncbi:N-6 DNA methylase [Sedimentibacter sp. MB35-C1]|uniref:N-6 DNA methylase n=1 Tax=Sedimentibacter sp. MB35-C1 TaxID=3070995 RepID=UPI0027E03162|nr:N-6 DNA methylase [Sedimentibacter sp. MB35-C1]WMJ77842.1 N-6 DNA methylase [Sedimentibacter sp. MB35-C1]
MTLNDIFKNTNYDDSIFSEETKSVIESAIFIKKVRGVNLPYIKCIIRNKEIRLTPEEAVRQLYLYRLINEYGYPISRIQLETPIHFGREVKRADITIMDKDRPTVPYIIVELKKPKLTDGKEQLKSYCNATGAPIGLWTNGEQISCYNRKDPNFFESISDIPNVTQKLSDILNEKFTYEDLKKKDKISNERRSLRNLIKEMEDEVLASAGVDSFEEIFKLIFTKLYDELICAKDKTTYLKFRNSGDTDFELKEKIQGLFDNAKKKWIGVFPEESKILLSPSHLAICVSTLQDIKLFNNNLDVVDDAFEYLMSKAQKGEKGQYFTPRYVIDMCVKMMNPTVNDKIIDTACGSSGFTVHSIFYIWKAIRKAKGLSEGEGFTTDERTTEEINYVRDNVFAIDFDEKTVRVARTLNLIAGDGRTNVLHLNTLDYTRWNEITKQEDWNDTYNEGFRLLKKLQTKGVSDYSQFQFDIVMANPPFAGDIKEQQILSRYELAKNNKGKWQKSVGRDILFIERNLNFLKPGGRMAVILPQGRFNNSSDKRIREFIAERCRILAVVGLHGNVFKPHTGTKTSVLFVQKWDDELCPKKEDYNIFFATMRKPSKDNSGDKIYRKDENGDILLDSHKHFIVDHDLYNHDGMTEYGIAEAFIEFAKKEGLSFFQ